MTTPAILRLEDHTQAVLLLLRTVAGLDVFDGEPDARMDTDGRAHPYAALYPAPGAYDPFTRTLCGAPGPLDWTFQVTAAGGDPARARRACTRVLTALDGQILVQGSGSIGLVGDPGPMRHDTDVTPDRWYFPLIFTVQLP